MQILDLELQMTSFRISVKKLEEVFEGKICVYFPVDTVISLPFAALVEAQKGFE